MTQTSPLPSLRMTCPACEAEMIRVWADGLKIGDGGAIVQAGYEQACTSCGAVYGESTVLPLSFGTGAR